MFSHTLFSQFISSRSSFHRQLSPWELLSPKIVSCTWKTHAGKSNWIDCIVWLPYAGNQEKSNWKYCRSEERDPESTREFREESWTLWFLLIVIKVSLSLSLLVLCIRSFQCFWMSGLFLGYLHSVSLLSSSHLVVCFRDFCQSHNIFSD